MSNVTLSRLALAGLAALAAGCGSLGTGTVSPDRSGYSDAIGSSWKEQMLLNLVKIKYGDVPVFLDVSSVIASYTFEATGEASAEWDPLNQRSTAAAIGGTYTDRPTITYVPLTGEKFTKALLTPIPPTTIFSMVQSGWPVDRVFGAAVRSVNGVRNQNVALLPSPADGAWSDLMESWAVVQASGAIDLRVRRVPDGESIVIVLGEPRDPVVVHHAQRIREILGAPGQAHEWSIAYGALQAKPGEIALLTRSLFEIFLEIAATVEVPEEDTSAGRVLPMTLPGAAPILAIRSSDSRPSGAAAATRYRGRWYYVADDDFRSKNRLMFLFFIQAMLESGSKAGAAPMLTIST